MKGLGCEHNNLEACSVCLQGDAYGLALTVFLAQRYVDALVQDISKLTSERLLGSLKGLQEILDTKSADVSRILGQG